MDIHDFSPAPVLWESADRVLRTQLRHGLGAYLAETPPAVRVRSIRDLIAFNRDHADRELALFGQEILVDAALMGEVDDPDHMRAVAALRRAARDDGVDRLLAENGVELLLMPSAPLPFVVDVVLPDHTPGERIGAGWLPAMAGYPILSVPMGEHRGLPLGLAVTGTAWSDAEVLAVGEAYERASRELREPTYPAGPFRDPATAALVSHLETVSR
ncbi:MAG: hypothetical protein MI919_24620 [Holophagales bacterium]|nr:hypothetical protein [Holophagales bacterium]